MPMVYRTSPWLTEQKKKLNSEARLAAGKPKPVSNLGGGRGGSLIAFVEATGVANGFGTGPSA